MLLRALLESQFEVFAQQCAIDIPDVIAHDVGLPSTCYHHGENNTTGPKWPRARVCAFNCLQDQTHSAKRYGFVMARVSGLEKKQAPWHLRWFYGVMRKMFGKDFTPAKIQMRLPSLVWGGIAMEAALGRKRLISLRYIQLRKIRAAARIGCPF